MLTPAQLDGYLDRIGFHGTAAADLETLNALHRAHLGAIPYENLDVHLRRKLSLDADDLYAKMVVDRRGGYCFEQNALFWYVLRAFGFTVAPIDGQASRELAGHSPVPTHMPLIATVEGRRYLVDVGVGDGFHEPLPLEVGEYADGIWTHRMTVLGDGIWRCVPDPNGALISFDFWPEEPRTIDDYRAPCHLRATDPGSPHLRVMAVQMPAERVKTTLRGAQLTFAGPDEPDGKRRVVLETREDFAAALDVHFGLRLAVDELDVLWPAARAQYLAWLKENGG
ncbi:arylamine N-acetyltransferase [Actinorhabdospora filicis]|uniref:Arylamine N-acetyltransferase n=1 Tax=Actinorhabdospora filicis TaxID=1785913 RepID=A0A9W6SPI4_9ACTN|nr:arylamine N-acetyltransferase [Actinorhabdospora filicis]GLZ80605.1 arylamine N-acetyltransferase [Actinorhabdospora filicis]